VLLIRHALACYAFGDPRELSLLMPWPKGAIRAGLLWTRKSGPKIGSGIRSSNHIGHHPVAPIARADIASTGAAMSRAGRSTDSNGDILRAGGIRRRAD
jgi:hypothetical protein